MGYLQQLGMDIPRLEIGLRADNHTRNVRDPTKVHDFVVDNLNHFKRLAGSDRVDENVAMDTDSMFGVQDGVLVLEVDEKDVNESYEEV